MAEPSNPPCSDDPVLDVHGLAKLLKMSSRSIWRKISTGELPPPFEIGRTRRWYRAAVEGWLAEQAAKAMKGGRR